VEIPAEQLPYTFTFSGAALIACFFISTWCFRNCYYQLKAPDLSLSSSSFSSSKGPGKNAFPQPIC